MPKEAVFTLKLEPQLRAEFTAAAAGEDRPASQVVRELMRDYINRRQQTRQYDDYLRGKVEIARQQRAAGLSFPNEEVEEEASARRAQLRRRANKADR
jgi:predicted transcriptional regulator